MHGSCKFNKSYEIHENKTSSVQHRSKPLMTTTTTDTNVVIECNPLAIALLIALYCIVSDEIKCATFGLSCKCSKIWEWSECGRKARHKKWIEKKSFWPPWHAWDLNAWCGCDRSFLYLFDSNPSSHGSRGVDWLLRHSTILRDQIRSGWTFLRS